MSIYKDKNILELFEKIDDQLYYLLTHNKNYTKLQMGKLVDIDDLLQEIKERIY